MTPRAIAALLLGILLVAGCGKAPAPPPPAAARPAAAWHVDVYPFSPEKPEVLKQAVDWANGRVAGELRIVAPVPVLWENIESGGRASSAALLHLMISQARGAKPQDRLMAVIGVADRDMGDLRNESVASVAARDERAAVLSWYRLRNETKGLPADDDRLAQRVGKQMITMIGREMGLQPCRSPQCLLFEPPSLAALDAQTGVFCPKCRRDWQAKVGSR